MPATLSHLSRNKGRLTHTFEDGATVTITYRPGRITPRQLHRADALAARGEDQLTQAEQRELMDEQTRLLASALIDWDLQDDQGQPIPPTREGLEDVDYEAQQIILEWIVEDSQLGKSNGTAPSQALSTDTSASPAPVPMIRSSRPSPNGTSTKRRRAGSV
jgi:hypothetical protein